MSCYVWYFCCLEFLKLMANFHSISRNGREITSWCDVFPGTDRADPRFQAHNWWVSSDVRQGFTHQKQTSANPNFKSKIIQPSPLLQFLTTASFPSFPVSCLPSASTLPRLHPAATAVSHPGGPRATRGAREFGGAVRSRSACCAAMLQVVGTIFRS